MVPPAGVPESVNLQMITEPPLPPSFMFTLTVFSLNPNCWSPSRSPCGQLKLTTFFRHSPHGVWAFRGDPKCGWGPLLRSVSSAGCNRRVTARVQEGALAVSYSEHSGEPTTTGPAHQPEPLCWSEAVTCPRIGPVPWVQTCRRWDFRLRHLN